MTNDNNSQPSDTSESVTVSPFKVAHTFHKRDGNDPTRIDDLDRVVDFLKKADHDRHGISPINSSFPPPPPSACNDSLGSSSYYHGPIFGIAKFPGFLFAPQALSDDLQLELTYASVSEYCEAPHRTNIDLCPPKVNESINVTDDNTDERMWTLWKQQQQHDERPGQDDSHSSTTKTQTKKKAKTRHRTSTGELNTIRYYKSFQKLSWATMGYHYDWTARSYNMDHKSPMPTLVGTLATIFANTCLHLLNSTNGEKREEKEATTPVSFVPSASIVNYYTTKSTMGGHRDDLELALDKPIVSISLGLPAIFLLGGTTKDREPVLAVLLRPGDVLCMGGESRLNVHAMARVLPIEAAMAIPSAAATAGAADDDNDDVSSSGDCSNNNAEAITLEQMRGKNNSPLSQIPDPDRPFLAHYLRHHRININVRQVYPDEVEKM